MSPVMSIVSVSEADPIASGSAPRVGRDRTLLVLSTLAMLALAATLGSGAAASTVEPDLARLLRFMAVLKGVFAVVALVVCYWRLARPTAAWREIVFVGGPGLMAAGALCLWNIQSAGLATAGLHVGMFALLAAGLTDEAFIPALRRRRV